MLTQLHNYMGLAVNDASVAAEYLKTQDTSWMKGEQDRITKLLDKEIKMSGDSNQNLKEEHAGQLGYTSR
jgi:hypothetical protein